MTAEPLNSSAKNARVATADQPVAAAAAAAAAAADVDNDCERHHLSVPSPFNRDADPWLLPQRDNDDSPHWNGMSLHVHN